MHMLRHGRRVLLHFHFRDGQVMVGWRGPGLTLARDWQTDSKWLGVSPENLSKFSMPTTDAGAFLRVLRSPPLPSDIGRPRLVSTSY